MMNGFGMHSFTPHIAVFLGLLALAAGYQVLHQAKSDTCCGGWGKFVGILISVVSLLGLVCITYLSLSQCCGVKKDGAWLNKHMEMMAPPAEGTKK